jgi:hypothetical protein
MCRIEQKNVTLYTKPTYLEISYVHLTTIYVMQNEICSRHTKSKIGKKRKN